MGYVLHSTVNAAPHLVRKRSWAPPGLSSRWFIQAWNWVLPHYMSQPLSPDAAPWQLWFPCIFEVYKTADNWEESLRSSVLWGVYVLIITAKDFPAVSQVWSTGGILSFGSVHLCILRLLVFELPKTKCYNWWYRSNESCNTALCFDSVSDTLAGTYCDALVD